MKATLENVKEIAPAAGRNWHIKFRCANCGEDSGKLSTISTAEEKV
jgi:hypothetical protein